jgi:hypothetical protein
LASGQASTDELTALALSTPSGTWPQLDQDSLSYLITALHTAYAEDLPPDPRRAYWSLDWDSGKWALIADHIHAVAAPTGWNPAKTAQFSRSRSRR